MKIFSVIFILCFISCSPSRLRFDKKVINDLPKYEEARNILLDNISYIHLCNAKVREKPPDSIPFYISANEYYFNEWILDSTKADLMKISEFFRDELFEGIHMSDDSCFSFMLKSFDGELFNNTYTHTLCYVAHPDCFDFSYDKKDEVWVEKEKHLSGKWIYVIDGVNAL